MTLSSRCSVTSQSSWLRGFKREREFQPWISSLSQTSQLWWPVDVARRPVSCVNQRRIRPGMAPPAMVPPARVRPRTTRVAPKERARSAAAAEAASKRASSNEPWTTAATETRSSPGRTKNSPQWRPGAGPSRGKSRSNRCQAVRRSFRCCDVPRKVWPGRGMLHDGLWHATWRQNFTNWWHDRPWVKREMWPTPRIPSARKKTTLFIGMMPSLSGGWVDGYILVHFLMCIDAECKQMWQIESYFRIIYIIWSNHLIFFNVYSKLLILIIINLGTCFNNVYVKSFQETKDI